MVVVVVCGGRRNDANGAYEGRGHGIPRWHAEEEERDLVAHAHAREAPEERQQLAAHERGGAAEDAVAGHAEALQQAALRAEEKCEEVVERPAPSQLLKLTTMDTPRRVSRRQCAWFMPVTSMHQSSTCACVSQQHGGVQVHDAPAAEHPPPLLKNSRLLPLHSRPLLPLPLQSIAACPRPAAGDVATV